MPIFDYECPTCGWGKEYFLLHNEPLPKCHKGHEMKKLPPLIAQRIDWGTPQSIPTIRNTPFESQSDYRNYCKEHSLAPLPEGTKNQRGPTPVPDHVRREKLFEAAKIAKATVPKRRVYA